MQRVVIQEEEVKNTLKNTDVRFMRLWDLYGGLLTDTQREITELYFECDLSLGEIAEQKEVSRQSVSDCLQKCRKKLEEAEKKLRFAQMMDDVLLDYSLYMTRVRRWAEEQANIHPEWAEALEQLQAITGHDTEIIEIED